MSDVHIDYELDEFVHLDTPERLRAASEPVRAHILDLVLERAMTVTELASRTGKAKGTVAHHVDLLVEHGLLKVVRVRKVRAMEERFYGRVARTMVFDGGKGHDLDDDLPFFAEARREADFDAMRADSAPAGFTLRHARIPLERAKEWTERFDALALEFSRQPRSGEIEFGVVIGMFPTKRRVTPRKKAKKSPS